MTLATITLAPTVTLASKNPATASKSIKQTVKQASEPNRNKSPAYIEELEKTAPLKPIDISSPRATLEGFIGHMNEIYSAVQKIRKSYFESSRLYLSDQEQAAMKRFLPRIKEAERTLNLSKLPPALLTDAAIRRTLLELKEVLDRIDIPPPESIPDAAEMETKKFKFWTIPDTEIAIGLVKEGPNAGQYQFTPETVARMTEFYAKVKQVPYNPGASAGWYDTFNYGPAGLVNIIPYRWMINFPPWLKTLLLDQPLWRWIGLGIVLFAAYLLIRLISKTSRQLIRLNSHSTLRIRWALMMRPIGLLILLPILVFIFAYILGFSGTVYRVGMIALWTGFYLVLTWVAWDGGNAVAETIIASKRLQHRTIDSQLIRLGERILVITAIVAILIEGASRIGLPAYSIFAGLGVSGIAVALAARESLANLLGSLIIMFEKPFRIGHIIRVDNIEGEVEDIGFRSTRIRTFYNSLVSIPSSKLIEATVDNLGLREFRRVKTVLQITYGTPAAKVEEFVEGIKTIIKDNEHTRKDYFHVVFHDFGASSLDILVYFFFKVPDWSVELIERQRILIEIMKLAEKIGISFAFPTQTLHIESAPEHQLSSGIDE
ncbi:MAG: mechanosensitive ion channel family protein [Gammaproteobacteria bacterium]